MTGNDDLRVAMVASLQDRLVGPLRRTLDEVERNLRDVERELQGVQRESTKAGRTMSEINGPLKAARQVSDLARNTQNATTLAERLERAWSRTGNIIKGVGSGIAAWQAFRYVVSGPMQTQRSYERQLADASNTAFADRDLAGRQAGRAELDAIVVSSLRAGGGKREEVLAGLNEMLASGVVNAGQARQVLPTVARYATAGNASVTELSSIVVRALQAGFKEADIPRLLDMALVAGQVGGFELKDMAKWLPKLLAAGRMSGLTGMEGYARILASAEASVTTAGSKEEAGNNLLNLLLKINGSDTAQDAKKLGIDLSGSLAAARAKGVNSLDAFVNLAEQVAARDPRLATLRKQAASATTDEDRRANLLAQADILQGSAIGKIVQDRQALLALVAEMQQRSTIRSNMAGILAANGRAGDLSFANIASTADFRVQQGENEKLFAQGQALAGVNSSLGTLSEKTTELYQKYPALAEAMEGLKLAVNGVAAAAGAAAGVLALLGLAGGGKALAGAAAASGAARTAVGVSSLMNGPAAGVAAASGLAAPVAGLVGMPLAVLGAGVYMNERMNTVQGLTDRINTRNARLSELNELAKLDRPGKYDSEIAALTADREKLRDRYGEQVGGGRGVTNVKVYLDGREMNAHVEEETAYQARRR